MYLTQITLDPTAYRARALLCDTQKMHAALTASFPDPGRPGERLLWRIDQRSAADIRLLIASPDGPDLGQAEERIAPVSRIETRDYEPLLARITEGSTFSFRIAANPTSYKRSEQPKEMCGGAHLRTHHRSPLNTSGHLKWIVGKLSSVGAKVLDTDIDGASVPDVVSVGLVNDRFARVDGKQRQIVELVRASFQGHLTVIDPASFRVAMRAGIGPAKGYGCGLLTLAVPTR